MNCNDFDCTINYFDLVNVEKDASKSEINKAYIAHRAMAVNDAAMMAEISNIFDVVKHFAVREDYAKYLRSATTKVPVNKVLRDIIEKHGDLKNYFNPTIIKEDSDEEEMMLDVHVSNIVPVSENAPSETFNAVPAEISAETSTYTVTITPTLVSDILDYYRNKINNLEASDAIFSNLGMVSMSADSTNAEYPVDNSQLYGVDDVYYTQAIDFSELS